MRKQPVDVAPAQFMQTVFIVHNKLKNGPTDVDRSIDGKKGFFVWWHGYAHVLGRKLALVTKFLYEAKDFFVFDWDFYHCRQMCLSEEDLVQLIAKAHTLKERFGGEFAPVADDGKLAARRLARWKLTAANNDEVRFADVLSALGQKTLSTADLLGLLGPVKRQTTAPPPRWAVFLQNLVPEIARRSNEPRADAETKTATRTFYSWLPWADLLVPIGQFIWGRIEADFPFAKEFAPAAQRGLQAHLLKRCSEILSVPLSVFFSAHKAIAQQGRSEAVDIRTEGASDRYYPAFVRAQGREGLKTFFLAYPAAARLLADVSIDWIEATGEFLQRLESDRSKLAEVFNQGKTLGEVVGIQAGLSDPHHGGRTVAILIFEDGLRLVYKPRSLQVDHRFYVLAEAANAAGLKPALHILRVYDRGEYGWMEFAGHVQCRNDRAIRRFYRRAGALAMLVHWLQGIDCHRYNMIAAGEYPVLVDLETLAHPLRGNEIAHAKMSDPWNQGRSILRTGLLPFWQPRPGRGLYNNSGLGAPILLRPLAAKICWKNLHTDQIHWKLASSPRRWTRHRPRLANRAVNVRVHAKAVLLGFREMALFLKSADGGEFARLRDSIFEAKRRQVRRPTVAYAVLLQISLRPEYLLDGLERSLSLQALPHHNIEPADRERELASLEKLDVPYFEIAAGGLPSALHSSLIKPDASAALIEQTEIVQAALCEVLVLVNGRYEPNKAKHHVGPSVHSKAQ